MRRFFLTAAEGAEIVALALRERSELRGQVLTQRMSAARIRDILAVWTERSGGSWEPAGRRTEDSDDEWLVGEPEAVRTHERALGDERRYLIISHGPAVADPLPGGLSTANAPTMGIDAIQALLDAEPR
jgi:hypothetical protein